MEGRVIPPENEVAGNPWITHRDPEIYGLDGEGWVDDEKKTPKVYISTDFSYCENFTLRL